MCWCLCLPLCTNVDSTSVKSPSDSVPEIVASLENVTPLTANVLDKVLAPVTVAAPSKIASLNIEIIKGCNCARCLASSNWPVEKLPYSKFLSALFAYRKSLYIRH